MPIDRRSRVLELVDDELRSAQERWPAFNSAHEGIAVIWEEMDELWEQVKANRGRDSHAIAEAVQLAAMAARYVHDLADWG